MKPPVFKGAGKPLAIEDRPDPTPGPGELVLEVGRCGICGTDLHMTDGHAQTFPAESVIGHEFAGAVVAVGAGVERFAVGDIVSALPVVGCGECGSCTNTRSRRRARPSACRRAYQWKTAHWWNRWRSVCMA